MNTIKAGIVNFKISNITLNQAGIDQNLYSNIPFVSYIETDNLVELR